MVADMNEGILLLCRNKEKAARGSEAIRSGVTQTKGIHPAGKRVGIWASDLEVEKEILSSKQRNSDKI